MQENTPATPASPSAVEEFLRYETPFNAASARFTPRPGPQENRR